MQSLRQHTLTLTETAAAVGVSADALKQWLKQGRYSFPAPRKIGGRNFFSLTEVQAWLASPDRVSPTYGPCVGERHPNAYPKELVAQALKMHFDRGYSLDKVASILGVSKPAVQKWVNGSRRPDAR